MTARDSFLKLKGFFESRQAAKQAMSVIKEGVEIGIIVGETIECALFRRGDLPIVEERAALNPDLIFHIRPETVDVLSSNTKDDIGDIGVSVLKEALAGNIRMKVPGRILNLLSRGYLDMVREGGTPVVAFLTRHGLASLTKITSFLKEMKR